MYQLDLGSSQTTEAEIRRVAADMRARFPDAGFEVRTRMNASPQLASQIERFSQFLTLVGLTALLVGGVGVANAVASLVDRKRDDIATLKALGATGGLVFAATLTQVGLLALVGTAIGLVAGAALPSLVVGAFGSVIPIPVSTTVQPLELATAAAYGLLVALTFALWPLGRAHDIRSPRCSATRSTATVAGRGRAISPSSPDAGGSGRPVGRDLVQSAPRHGLHGGAAGIFVTLRLVAAAIMAIAARMPRARNTSLRLAVANLHRPGALTPSVVLSLGLGLTLLAVIALVDASFRRQIEDALPARAPSFFFVDIVNAEAPRFDAFIKEKAPDADLNRVPMLRGRFVRLGGRPVEEIRARDDIAWALRGDRGITYAATVPQNSRVVEGSWWPADYSGPPLVSFDERMGQGFGLKIGDEVTVNVLGRNITARIANFRNIQWDNLGINFIVVFSPNTFRGAPHAHLATLTYRHPRRRRRRSPCSSRWPPPSRR